MLPVTERACAKINLCLHVTGQRDDGYHLLDSLVAFASVHDRLMAVPAAKFSLHLEGPFGKDIPDGADNLVLRAARAVAPDFPVSLTLEKNLPPASGIGGGSADAAAAVRAIMQLARQRGLSPNVDPSALLALGADVPVCFTSAPARMRGVGERVETLSAFPQCPIVLINPKVEVPTPAVFRALARKSNPAMPDVLPVWPDVAALADWLQIQRNDLQAPAMTLAPVIGRVLDALSEQPGALLVRMSGSGATCFALFATDAAAKAAVAQLCKRHPDWWIAGGVLDAPNSI